MLSGSSDGTVRLWSLGQQRCIETFHVHDEGVWALAVDEEFTAFYSGGRDKRVCVTELNQGKCALIGDICLQGNVCVIGGAEGVLLFTESNPVLDLALDTSGSCTSLWVATTATQVNKWPVDVNRVNGFTAGGEGSSEEEEVGVTYIDEAEPTPLFAKPISTVPGIVPLTVNVLPTHSKI